MSTILLLIVTALAEYIPPAEWPDAVRAVATVVVVLVGVGDLAICLGRWDRS